MIHRTRDLSPDQRIAVEGLLGRPVSEDETISIRVFSTSDAPEWLLASWETASREDLNQMSVEEIDLEIAAARSERRNRRQLSAP